MYILREQFSGVAPSPAGSKVMSTSEEGIFATEIFSHVSLMEDDYRHRIGGSAFGRRFSRDAEADRNISHVVENNSVVTVDILGDSRHAALQHVVTVEELLFGARLQPDLSFGVRRDLIQRRHLQPEFTCGRRRGRGEIKEIYIYFNF